MRKLPSCESMESMYSQKERNLNLNGHVCYRLPLSATTVCYRMPPLLTSLSFHHRMLVHLYHVVSKSDASEALVAFIAEFETIGAHDVSQAYRELQNNHTAFIFHLYALTVLSHMKEYPPSTTGAGYGVSILWSSSCVMS